MLYRRLFAITTMLLFSGHAFASAPTCDALFRAGRSKETAEMPLQSVADKFEKREHREAWLATVDAPLGAETQLQIKLRYSFAFNAKVKALEKRGLRVIEFPFDTAAGAFADAFLEGPADVILSALQEPAVASVVQLWRLQTRRTVRYFSGAGLRRGPWSADQFLLYKKFSARAVYLQMRASLLEPRSDSYQVIVTSALRRSETEFGRFIDDLGSLGISIDLSAPAAGARHLILQGRVENLFSVIRHPAITGVLRWDSEITEVKKDNIEADVTHIPWSSLRIVLAGESISPSEFGLLAERDGVIPSLLRVQTKNAPYLREIPHEELTAQDYAKYLARHHQQDFVYLSDYDGVRVPLFDGLIVTSDTHVPVVNVSLKCCMAKVDDTTVSQIRSDLILRLKNHIRQSLAYENPADWFVAINEGAQISRRSPERYENHLLRAQILASLFGLIPDPGKIVPMRPHRVVVDVRNHGYDFEFFKDLSVQNALQETVHRFHPSSPLSVTFLWDDHRGVEITSRGVTVYE